MKKADLLNAMDEAERFIAKTRLYLASLEEGTTGEELDRSHESIRRSSQELRRVLIFNKRGPRA